MKTFDEWFDEKYPEEAFGSLKGAFRLGMKNDIARKAYDFALESAAMIVEDHRNKQLAEEIRNLK